jgi:hypothetical protein
MQLVPKTKDKTSTNRVNIIKEVDTQTGLEVEEDGVVITIDQNVKSVRN